MASPFTNNWLEKPFLEGVFHFHVQLGSIVGLKLREVNGARSFFFFPFDVGDFVIDATQ